MPIVYHEKTKEFHLFNREISYIFTVLKNGQLGQLYYGKRLQDRESFQHLLEQRVYGWAVSPYQDDPGFSLEHFRQEYPAYGTGDMRQPAYEIRQKNGSECTEFIYLSHSITPGKPKLDGLPAVYTESDDEAVTLEVVLFDRVAQMKLVLSYTIYEEMPVIARNARFLCENPDGVVLERAMSLSVDLPDMDYEMIELTGAWARERSVRTRKLEYGIQAVYSMRGSSSSNFNPFLALKRPNTTESAGEAYGFCFVYSGNFLAQAEVDPFNVTRVTMGIHPMRFSWPLKNGEEFQTPEAVMVYSASGLNGMSRAFHKLFRTRLSRGYWRDRPRPILINNWEATYFDFTVDKVLKIAETAKELGMELFVLDDGWFGKRNDDTSSLGDWYPNLEKIPGGIKNLAEKIETMGLKFGLWFEPEMVSEDSELFRAHPDWRLSVPGRTPGQSRNQYVLDFSRPEVVEAIGNMMEKVLSDAPVSYVKWDMNRYLSDVFSHSAPAEGQGMVFHKYVLGVYRLYERLTARFPQILFESCSGGGSRFDAGMLYYAPQTWTSDDSDAVERLKIQYGTSMAYPVISMGSHVSAVPNHQVNRITPLETRANVAYFGTFGYELDLNKLTPEEKQAVAVQVAFMKEHRSLLQRGEFYRLLSPFEGNETAWMVVSDDKQTAIVGYYRVLEEVMAPYRRVRLQGLDPEKTYRIDPAGSLHGGDELMQYGLITSDVSSGWIAGKEEPKGDYRSRLYLLKAV